VHRLYLVVPDVNVGPLLEGESDHGLAMVKTGRANLQARLPEQKASFALLRFDLEALEPVAAGKRRRYEVPAQTGLRNAEDQIAFITLDQIPAIRFELVLDRVDEARGTINADGFLASEKEPQQLVEAGEMIHMSVGDKDIANAQELARWQPAQIAKIEKKRAPFKHEVDVKPGIAEGIVDQRRIEVSLHGAASAGRKLSATSFISFRQNCQLMREAANVEEERLDLGAISEHLGASVMTSGAAAINAQDFRIAHYRMREPLEQRGSKALRRSLW
jgi:hypothetical protein